MQLGSINGMCLLVIKYYHDVAWQIVQVVVFFANPQGKVVLLIHDLRGGEARLDKRLKNKQQISESVCGFKAG